VEREQGSYEFDCGVPRINHFFTEEFFSYEELLLTKTYELATEEIIAENLPPVAFISYCNDTAKIEHTVAKIAPLPEEKDFLQKYPAVKITWLGVSKDSQRMGAGTDMLDITKLIFASEENRTGCRIITVDARNSGQAVGLYRKAGFVFAKDSVTPEKTPNRQLIPMVFNLLGPWQFDPDLLKPIRR
jgi:ribosomal protein S18 acetylase RimI-like enzyme